MKSFLAIQNDRDRIGPTKKMKMSNQNSEDDCAVHIRSAEERVKHVCVFADVLSCDSIRRILHFGSWCVISYQHD